ncbi:unnamed protein product [[Candida] boidinii]|uniref:Unnamed protein product n=1 Tax=Candida boidinii TaxID=5477 RepID=A0ACB5TZZ1_CANBO|nr:unnamed protein product [[Candida] boidinii]
MGDDGEEQQQNNGEENSSDKRKVSVEEGKALAEEEGLLFFETSAKTSFNVNEVFMAIGQKIPDNKKDNGNGNGLNGLNNENNGRIDLNAPVELNNNSNGCAC